LEILILSKIGRDPKPMSEVFGFDFPEPTPKSAIVKPRRLPVTLMVSVPLLASAVAFSSVLEKRDEIIPQRADFSGFPLELGGWRGKQDRMEQIYLDALKLDDYIIADYKGEDGRSVNLYVAYYGSQSKGESAHSPRSCLPGGGWQIKSLTQRTLGDQTGDGMSYQVNRVLIQKGDNRQLVYYWFQGRGRVITNEFLVKWYLFLDALTKNRTDGALVRLTTHISAGDDLEAAERSLTSFAGQLRDVLGAYVPD
jgi:EpsI family protein